LVDREVYLIQGIDTTTTLTDANGDYGFSDVEPGDYTVAADTSGLPVFGRYEPAGEQAVSVGANEDEIVDFAYRRAEIGVSTTADATTVSTGGSVTISLELDVSEIPLPLTAITGSVAWPSAVMDYVEGSETGVVWDQMIANETPTGTLNFVGISVIGVSGDQVLALTFDLVAVSVGGAEFDPTLTQLAAIDPATGNTVDLLAVATLIESRVTVNVE
jgi:hypothetical protein